MCVFVPLHGLWTWIKRSTHSRAGLRAAGLISMTEGLEKVLIGEHIVFLSTPSTRALISSQSRGAQGRGEGERARAFLSKLGPMEARPFKGSVGSHPVHRQRERERESSLGLRVYLLTLRDYINSPFLNVSRRAFSRANPTLEYTIHFVGYSFSSPVWLFFISSRL